MIKQTLTIITIIVVFMVDGFAQRDWRQGMIFLNSGDTLNGFIDYRAPSIQGNSCIFKETGSKDVRRFTPGEITGYRFDDNGYFISKTVTIEEEETKVFLEVLFKGKVSLYFSGDGESYFVEKDNQLHELKNTTEMRGHKLRPYEVNKNEYIGVLNILFQDANVQSEIKNAKLKNKSLINLARTYHTTKYADYDILYEKRPKRLITNLGIVYGYNHKTLHITRQGNDFERDEGMSNFGGIALNFQHLPGIYDRFSLQVELLAYEYYYKNEKGIALNTPILLDYRLLPGKLYPKIELGASGYFMRKDDLRTQHMTVTGGLSIHYQYYKSYRIFIRTRIENNPRIIQFGAGLLF